MPGVFEYIESSNDEFMGSKRELYTIKMIEDLPSVRNVMKHLF